MSDIARYRLVLFAPPTGGLDHADHGRRLAAQLEDTGEAGAVPRDRDADQARIDGLASALQTHFDDAEAHRHAGERAPDDIEVNVSATVPAGEVEWTIAADFVELTLWSRQRETPTIDAEGLELLTRDGAGAGYSTIFDPQLDRIVTVGDAHEISVAWAGELQAGPADQTHERSSADAQQATGRGERAQSGGFLSRLLGRG